MSFVPLSEGKQKFKPTVRKKGNGRGERIRWERIEWRKVDSRWGQKPLSYWFHLHHHDLYIAGRMIHFPHISCLRTPHLWPFTPSNQTSPKTIEIIIAESMIGKLIAAQEDNGWERRFEALNDWTAADWEISLHHIGRDKRQRFSPLRSQTSHDYKKMLHHVFMKILCFSHDLVRCKENRDRQVWQVAAVKLSCIQTAECLAAQAADLVLND